VDVNKALNVMVFFGAALVLIFAAVWSADLQIFGVRSGLPRVGIVMMGIGGAIWALVLGIKELWGRK